jgi:hypothetical protein
MKIFKVDGEYRLARNIDIQSVARSRYRARTRRDNGRDRDAVGDACHHDSETLDEFAGIL